VAKKKDARTRWEKTRDTLIDRYGEDYFQKLGVKAGAASTSRPFATVPGAARKAVNARWERYRARKAAEEAK
jgi:hypothetical protein